MTDGPIPAANTIAGALADARVLLPASSASLDTQLLLAHVLNRPRSWLLAHAEALLDAKAQTSFAQLAARRAAGEPMAYILGYREFWSLPLHVSVDVLVPRPETELLVERALALLPADAADIADLGTGSGAIALALASERPAWRLTATDRSAPALTVAADNATRLGLGRVQFACGDWFSPLGGSRYAMIVSNPPYIADDDPALQDLALQHEPRIALSSGAEGLDALRTIIVGAADHLLPHGWLVLEHGAEQANAVASLLVSQGFTHVRCHADLAGFPRVTEAQHN
jgi:release factor glutamine methyltransferase